MLELPAVGKQARQWRGIAGKWAELAEAAVNGSRPEFTWIRGLTTAVSGVRAGDEAQEAEEAAAESGEELWRLRALRHRSAVHRNRNQ
jgi:hypothetical protein